MNVEPRGKNIPFLFDRTPLVIYTSEENGFSWFQGEYDDSSEPQGKGHISVSWKWEPPETGSVWVSYHHTEYQNLTINVPTVADKIWKVYKLRTKFVMECNDVFVYEIYFKDLFDTEDSDTSQRSMKDWLHETTHIRFSTSSENSVYFAAGGKMRNNEMKSNLIPSLTVCREGGKCKRGLENNNPPPLSVNCYAGYYFVEKDGCLECPGNTYSTSGSVFCTPCPSTTPISPPGSTSQLNCTSSLGRMS